MKNKEFGKRLESTRTTLGITRTQLAEFIGTDEKYVADCEKGEKNYSSCELNMISNLMGCTVDELESNEELTPRLPLTILDEPVTVEDLVAIVAIASINKIFQNQKKMAEMLV